MDAPFKSNVMDRVRMQRFIHITDLHFWRVVYNPCALMNKRLLGNLNLILRRRRYIHLEWADTFLQLLKRLEADALLVGGDLTTTATHDEYRMARAFLEKASEDGLPIYLIPGNHDFYTFEACRRRRFERYLGNWLDHPHAPGLSQLPGGAQLLRVPTARPNLLSSRGYISDAQLTETAKLLEQADNAPIIVLAHYPVLPNPGVYPSNMTRRLGNAAALRRLLGESGRPICYLAGHVHVFSHLRDAHYPNIEQITTSALLYDKPSHPGGFTEIAMEHNACQAFPWTRSDDWTRGALSQAKHLR